MAEVGRMIVRVARALNAENYNILQNNGRLAHQEVDHVHFHIIPKPNETEGLGMRWPAQSGDKDAIAAKAKEILNRL